jgi:hypothetical protein
MSSEKPLETVPERDDPIELVGEYMTKAIRHPRETADRFVRGIAEIVPSKRNPITAEAGGSEAPRSVVGGASHPDRIDRRRRCSVSNIAKPEKEKSHGSASDHRSSH